MTTTAIYFDGMTFYTYCDACLMWLAPDIALSCSLNADLN